MIEALLALFLVAGALFGFAGVLKSEWNETRCVVLAFESAHRRLTGAPAIPTRARRPALNGGAELRVTEDATRVVAEARCGSARERVELVKLEEARW